MTRVSSHQLPTQKPQDSESFLIRFQDYDMMCGDLSKCKTTNIKVSLDVINIVSVATRGPKLLEYFMVSNIRCSDYSITSLHPNSDQNSVYVYPIFLINVKT